MEEVWSHENGFWIMIRSSILGFGAWQCGCGSRAPYNERVYGRNWWDEKDEEVGWDDLVLVMAPLLQLCQEYVVVHCHYLLVSFFVCLFNLWIDMLTIFVYVFRMIYGLYVSKGKAMSWDDEKNTNSYMRRFYRETCLIHDLNRQSHILWKYRFFCLRSCYKSWFKRNEGAGPKLSPFILGCHQKNASTWLHPPPI